MTYGKFAAVIFITSAGYAAAIAAAWLTGLWAFCWFLGWPVTFWLLRRAVIDPFRRFDLILLAALSAFQNIALSAWQFNYQWLLAVPAVPVIGTAIIWRFIAACRSRGDMTAAELAAAVMAALQSLFAAITFGAFLSSFHV